MKTIPQLNADFFLFCFFVFVKYSYLKKKNIKLC